jgi:ABC-type branched-subunit amino acid transport system substrate-binding protein
MCGARTSVVGRSRLPRVRRLAVILGGALVLAGCGGSDDGGADAKRLTVLVNAPFSLTPYVGETIARGAELGALAANAEGLEIDGQRYELVVKRADNRLSPGAAVRNVREAADDDEVVAVVDEGTGVDASWRIAQDGDLPLGIVYQGGGGLVDPDARPNVFRIAPTDRGLAFRLAEYTIPKGLRLAIVTDDSGYGREGRETLDKAFSGNRDSVAAEIQVPANATDVAPQILRARRSGATGLLIWAQPPALAAAVTAARSAGWDVPIFAPPSAEDPLVRQELSDHPEWLDGLTFASGRMTAEKGPGPFLAFNEAFENRYGAQRVGVRTTSGEPVIQPPDYAMYAYDFVRVVAAAMRAADQVRGEGVLANMERVTIAGANGDERSFNENNHDGVIDDDVYFARFGGMTFAPVNDDPLSASLGTIDQTR